jgi:GPH family glycoside/pentoside/hexuronide:cation symporter
MDAKRKSIWDGSLLQSKAKKDKVGLAEMIFGYFIGPFCVLAMTSVISTYYLTFYRTYDDIVNQGAFLTLLPLLSVIPMAITNIIIGIVVGKTRTRAGKARPYILAAAPLLLVFGILVFCIPYLSLGVRMIWMAITYNLFAALANPIYGTSHYLMVSLSTRDLNQRGQLSVVANIPAVAGNGLISSILMPVILGWINSAPTNDIVQNRWQLTMTCFAVAAFVGCLLEYFFTRERITEEDWAEPDGEAKAAVDAVGNAGATVDTALENKVGNAVGAGGRDADGIVSTKVQLQSAMRDKFWWIIIIFYLLYQMGVMFKGGYVFNIFCHEYFAEVNVLGMTLSADMAQSVLALISGVPLAAGMLFIWPLANKFGKKNMIVAGCVVSIIGSVVCLINPGNFMVVLIGQTLKGFSSIPGAYIMMALFADVLDHLEARFGFRVDGVSMSVYNTVITVVNGLAVAVFNFFYDSAFFSGKTVSCFFFVGFEIIAHGILIVLLRFLTVEKNIKEEQGLIARRKAERQGNEKDG